MRWSEAHEEAMFAAAEAHEELEIDPHSPIDIFAAIRAEGLDLLFRPLRGLSGLYLPATPGIAAGVLVSSHHPLARQRLTAAHELGHHRLGHQGSIDPLAEERSALAAEPLAPAEMLAEAFAAWFLMPPELADSALVDMGIKRPRGPLDTYQLALRMGTSYQATLTQLPNLRLATIPEVRRWAHMPVKMVKQELSRGIPMRSYRADIHLLGMSSRRRRVGPGDRLLLAATGPAVMSSLPPGAEMQAEWPDPQDPARRILAIDLDETWEGNFELSVEGEGSGWQLEIAGPELGRERDAAERESASAVPLEASR
jgi:hypothetical protein